MQFSQSGIYYCGQHIVFGQDKNNKTAFKEVLFQLKRQKDMLT